MIQLIFFTTVEAVHLLLIFNFFIIMHVRTLIETEILSLQALSYKFFVINYHEVIIAINFLIILFFQSHKRHILYFRVLYEVI
jgi:hypothetical protein